MARKKKRTAAKPAVQNADHPELKENNPIPEEELPDAELPEDEPAAADDPAENDPAEYMDEDAIAHRHRSRRPWLQDLRPG